MKKIIFCMLLIIIIILISGCSQERVGCFMAGGEWKTFPDSCGDKCSAEVCAEVLSAGCDCGENKCWDEGSCVQNQNFNNSEEFTSCVEILNKNQDKPKESLEKCLAEPDLYLNKKTGECLFRGCGYSSYTSPGPEWTRIR